MDAALFLSLPQSSHGSSEDALIDLQTYLEENKEDETPLGHLTSKSRENQDPHPILTNFVNLFFFF